jgi:hypothetical protein
VEETLKESVDCENVCSYSVMSIWPFKELKLD